MEGENDRERERERQAESPQATGPERGADENCILEPGLLVPELGLIRWAVPCLGGCTGPPCRVVLGAVGLSLWSHPKKEAPLASCLGVDLGSAPWDSLWAAFQVASNQTSMASVLVEAPCVKCHSHMESNVSEILCILDSLKKKKRLDTL